MPLWLKSATAVNSKRRRAKFIRKGNFHVYILECADKTYYTGYTPYLEKRIELHNNGKGAKYTRGRLPVKLVWSREYKYYRKAFLEEKRIQSLTRKEKEELVNNKCSV